MERMGTMKLKGLFLMLLIFFIAHGLILPVSAICTDPLPDNYIEVGLFR